MLRPLADAGLDKAAVRRIARVLELPCADKPAAPCLASRIPHFEEVSPEKLAQVEAAEAGLRSLGFADCRVRHHGEVARIELTGVEKDREQSPDDVLVFDPTRVIDGIETTEDPVLLFRPRAYAVSVERRSGAAIPAGLA